jgi:hypothetical protein
MRMRNEEKKRIHIDITVLGGIYEEKYRRLPE